MTKRCKTGDVYIGQYVDDCYCCRHQDDIETVILEMQNHGFELKIEQEMNDYLSFRIEFSKDRNKIWIGQLQIMKKICNVFEQIVEK